MFIHGILVLTVAPSAGRQGTLSAPEETQSQWIDPQDGWFDISRFLEHPQGFLPIVIPITEPALGYGAVVGAAFLDPREEAGEVGWARPNITFVSGMWTEDGSEGYFGGNSSLWRDGNLQTLIGGGTIGLELSLHGIGEDPALDGNPLDYRLDVDAIVGEGRQRLGESDWWLGLRFAYADATVDFDGSAVGIPGVDPGDDDVTLSGPALTLRYDSLDNMFSPTRGWLGDTSVSVYDDIFGASQDFQIFQQVLLGHWPLSETFFLGAKGQLNASFGDTPFFARPYVHLRGIPALRYQGEQAASAEAELRWEFHPRVSLIGFAGAGSAWTEFEEVEREQSAWSGGLGGRYLVSRKFGLLCGLDVAQGPEDTAVYVQFGNAWMRP